MKIISKIDVLKIQKPFLNSAMGTKKQKSNEKLESRLDLGRNVRDGERTGVKAPGRASE